VTGAGGFVGQALCEALARQGYRVRAALRAPRPMPSHIDETTIVGDIDAQTDWRAALEGAELVVHLAAKVHEHGGAAERYTQTNAYGTERLGAQALQAGVRRLVYLSTIKVNGEVSGQRPFTADDPPRPQDPYAYSKWQGEQFLQQTAAAGPLEIVIVRPPLVYGPRVRANFLRLLGWVHSGRPMPFAAVRNRRSLVSVWNLCDLISQLLQHPAAPGHVWMVSDGRDCSTADLIREIAVAMHAPVRLWPVPESLLRLAGALSGHQAEVTRLCGSLEADIAPTRQRLSWSPPLSMHEGLTRTVDWYLSATQ
jgi:nucleoside-diphosphate-sugar epimerase